MVIKQLVGLIVFGLLSACALNKIDEPSFALLTETDEQSHELIAATIARAIGQNSVLLAADVFQRSSLLTLERQPPRSLAGLPARGRDMTPPVQFRLIRLGNHCKLLKVDSEQHYDLPGVRCRRE